MLLQIMASSEVLGGDTLWQVMFACTCIPSAFSLSMFGVMPEVKRGPQGMMEANDKKGNQQNKQTKKGWVLGFILTKNFK